MLEVVAAPTPAMIQDMGRSGYMHQGVPPGGALVPEFFVAANRALANPANTPALEIYGELILAVRDGTVRVALDGHSWLAAKGSHISVPRSADVYVRYLAVQGGFNVPQILGGRSTLLGAAIGGFEGRLLRRGDHLKVGAIIKQEGRAPEVPAPSFAAPIRIISGPDRARFTEAAYTALLSEPFILTAARDRVGIRLGGARLARIDDDTAVSTPMAIGALQVPASGELIALGPDHPTTGGYPVIATVIRADFGRLAAQAPGASVEFREVTVAEARAAWLEYRTLIE